MLVHKMKTESMGSFVWMSESSYFKFGTYYLTIFSNTPIMESLSNLERGLTVQPGFRYFLGMEKLCFS